jgi:hypothetical protein
MRLNGYGRRGDFGALLGYFFSVVGASFAGTMIAGGVLLAVLKACG